MDDRPLKIAMVAGEASGDRQGAALLEALRLLVAPREVVAYGIGGDYMRNAGVQILHDCSRWSSIGIVAIGAALPRLYKFKADMLRALLADPPDVLVLIDSGGFNVRLAGQVKKRNICPIFYYFPPGSWRKIPAAMPIKAKWRRLAQVTDRIVTPFPWSADFLRRTGADASFVGHPLLDIVKPGIENEEFYSHYGLDPYRPLVALFPGSRRMEIKHILPVMIGAAGEITRRIPGIQFALALSPSVDRGQVEEIILREQRVSGRGDGLQLFMHQAGDKIAQIAQSTLTPPTPSMATNEGLIFPTPPEDENEGASRERATPSHAPLVICEDIPYDVMARSDLVITKSGTSTLEAMILQKPMIIVYKVSELMKAEYILRKRTLNISFFGMPNILADEEIFPELLQEQASSQAISELAVDMLLQPERLLKLKNRLRGLVHDLLGEPGAIKRTAELLYETIQSHTQNQERQTEHK